MVGKGAFRRERLQKTGSVIKCALGKIKDASTQSSTPSHFSNAGIEPLAILHQRQVIGEENAKSRQTDFKPTHAGRTCMTQFTPCDNRDSTVSTSTRIYGSKHTHTQGTN